MNLLKVATVLCIGLLIGVELAMSVFVNPVLSKLDLTAQAEPIRLLGRRLGTAMPVWYIASMLLLLSETVIHRHESVLLGVAVALWGAAIALSLLVLVPINNRLVRTNADGWTESTQREHRRWDALHRLRVFLLAVAMIFFLAGIGV